MRFKKSLIVLLVLNLFFVTTIVKPISASAEAMQERAVASKVASKAAKKVAKEFIKDAAVNTAVNMTINFTIPKDKIDKYKALESGYDAVFLPDEKGKPDESKPAQVKVPKTTAEKKALADKAEEILEKKIGMNGWLKFLDWFVPIFLVGGVFTWISTKLDPDSKDLFNQVAEESLEDLGYIKPLGLKNPINITDPEGNPVQTPESTPVENGTKPTISSEPKIFEYKFSELAAGTKSMEFTGALPISGSVVVVDIATSTMGSINLLNSISINGEGLGNVYYGFNNATFTNRQYGANSGTSLTYFDSSYIALNGTRYTTTAQSTGSYYVPLTAMGITKSTIQDVRRFILQFPTPGGNGYMMNSYLIDGKGNIYHTYNTTQELYKYVSTSSRSLTVSMDLASTYGREVAVRVGIYPSSANINVAPFNPSLKVPNALDNSIFNNVDGTVNLLPPTSIPITTPNGKPVKPNPDSSTGWTDTETGEDIEVNEDDLIVGDPKPTPEEDGYELPNGDKLPNPNPDKTEDEEGTEEKPEGDNSCEKPQKPDLKPISDSFTHAFPFSIPWDIKRFIDNIFGSVGSERPSFNLSFLGDNVTLEIPSYFDKWVSFAKTITLVFFDIGVMYLFYRWMKGGND